MSLDVGCGRNKRAEIGIDYNPNSNPDVISDAHNLPFRDRIFDEVASYCVLEHSYNPLNFLEEQYRVLKQGGILKCLTDNAQYFRWTVMKFREIRHEEIYKDHYAIFFPKNVIKLLLKAGFKNIKWSYVSFAQDLSKSEKLIYSLIKLGLFRIDCLYPRIFLYAQKPFKSQRSTKN